MGSTWQPKAALDRFIHKIATATVQKGVFKGFSTGQIAAGLLSASAELALMFHIEEPDFVETAIHAYHAAFARQHSTNRPSGDFVIQFGPKDKPEVAS